MATNKVTKEMIGAAHDICLKKGDFVLSADLLERIYLAMDALANHSETSGSLKEQLAAVKAENEKLREDADRYRWLRDEAWACYNFSKEKPEPVLIVATRDGCGNVKMILAEEALDAAIDAAMKEGK